MHNNPLVSVTMPAYNVEKYIGQAIESIINQTYENWELLICDDNSQDNTLEIIKTYSQKDSRISHFMNSKNLKELKTRNRLLLLAKGDYITFQDADDYSDPRRLELFVNEFKKNNKLGLISSQVKYVDIKGKLLRISKKPTTYKEVLKQIFSRNVVGGAIVMFKRTALEEVGGKFREYYDKFSYQDYDLSFLVAQKYEAYSLPQALYYYRQYGQSNSKIIDYNRTLANKVVIHLAKQRRDRGSDDLMDGRPELVDQYFDQLREPYIKDPSKIYREFAANFMYSKLYGKAIKSSWQSIIERPGYVKNWRTLFYCVRVSMTKILLFRGN